MEVAGGRQAVAAIGTGPADDRRRPFAEAGDLPAGGLHQPLDGEPEGARRQRVHLPHLGRGEDREGAGPFIHSRGD
jgi:hypothetical protein